MQSLAMHDLHRLYRRTTHPSVRRTDLGECDQCKISITWKNLPVHYAVKHKAVYDERWKHRPPGQLIEHAANVLKRTNYHKRLAEKTTEKVSASIPVDETLSDGEGEAVACAVSSSAPDGADQSTADDKLHEDREDTGALAWGHSHVPKSVSSAVLDFGQESGTSPDMRLLEPGIGNIKPCRAAVSGRAAAAPADSPSPPPSPDTLRRPATADGEQPFTWDSLMRHPSFAATPVSCFAHAPLSRSWRNMTAGLKLEVAQPPAKGKQTTYWVYTVLQVQGYRGLVRPEGLGSDSSRDRWVDLCSPGVKPIGWCAARGLPLTPPPGTDRDERDWQRLLVRSLTNCRTIPAGFYRKVQASLGSQLSVGQTIEVVDKANISQMRAARVSRVVGRRLHVHYLDAPEDDGGFWCHENSPLVHPVGWSVAVGHPLSAPEEYLVRCANRQYLPTDATQDYLPAPVPVTHDGFRVGMRLEALDPLNLGSIGVATVQCLLGNHFLVVRLETVPESAADGRDWFCYHATSPYIFPPGFCRTVGVPLSPPHGYTADAFSWERYLAVEGGQAAPAHLFHRPPVSHGFQRGHRVEAVDLMDPQLVCVATVAAVVGRLLRIHFDGWEEQFDQWVDAESPDLFPVGWATLVGYQLEPPHVPERAAKPRVQKRRVPKKFGYREKRGRGRPRLNRPAAPNLQAPGADSEMGAEDTDSVGTTELPADAAEPPADAGQAAADAGQTPEEEAAADAGQTVEEEASSTDGGGRITGGLERLDVASDDEQLPGDAAQEPTAVGDVALAETSDVTETLPALDVAEISDITETLPALDVAEISDITETLPASDVAEISDITETLPASDVAETSDITEALLASDVAEIMSNFTETSPAYDAMETASDVTEKTSGAAETAPASDGRPISQTIISVADTAPVGAGSRDDDILTGPAETPEEPTEPGSGMDAVSGDVGRQPEFGDVISRVGPPPGAGEGAGQQPRTPTPEGFHLDAVEMEEL